MKFNKRLQRKAKNPDTRNLAGGEAFTVSPKLELVALLLTSFLENKFYRSGNATVERVKELVAKLSDKEFVAKAAIYARREAGMRSVSHLIAGELVRKVKGAPWMKGFLGRVVFRVDDVLEILSYYLAVYGKPLPNSLKKGLGQALCRFDGYQLAKYRCDSAELKLVDAVNMLHPKHNEALGKLMRGTLAVAETWETRLSRAGQEADGEEDKAVKKAEAWTDLIRSGRIGYFALLRNLRNILEQAPELTSYAVALLVNRNLIARSLVLPFRFRTALDAIEAVSAAGKQAVLRALSKAADLSLANVPRFAGRTLLAVDCSGSMIGRPMKIASLFASVLYKTNEADLMLFSSDGKYVRFNKDDATLTIAQRIEEKAEWSGTNFHAVFERANVRAGYDRVIILSDMQGWVGSHAPVKLFEAYVVKARKRPCIYSFDLAGYGTLQFPEKGVACLAGFSDKTMEMMKFLESDQSSLLGEIERISLGEG
jgi:60 kDa SS-A/Ro ribonucleoprotein